MEFIRQYLLRLVICAFAASVAQTLVVQPRLRQIVRLCAACLLTVATLQPLVSLDISSIPELWQEPWSEASDPAQTAKEKNEALLASLVQEQTETVVREKLSALGIEANFTLSLRMDESVGAPVPWEITLYTACTGEQKTAMTAFLRDELGIPEARQEWRSP